MKSKRRRELLKAKNERRAARDAALKRGAGKTGEEYRAGGGQSKYADKAKKDNNPRSPFKPVTYG